MPEKSDHDLLTEIHAVLLGTNGQGGLCRDHDDLKKDYHRFKHAIIIILSIAAGSGALGFGLTEAVKHLGG